MQFFLAMTPPRTTSQTQRISVRNGKPRVYRAPELAEARANLIARLAGHAPAAPMPGALKVVTKWCWQAKPAQHGTPKATRPDVDNLSKMLLDCMTHCGFWDDDAQVASLVIEKFWSTQPGIFVSVTPWGEP